MGLRYSKRLKSKDLKELSEKTNVSKKELKEWHKSFIKDYPKGKVTKFEFKNIYKDFFPYGQAADFAEQIFSTFDDNGDGYVDFREIIIGLSVFKTGSVEQKLKWAFSMYDLDKDGTISRKEMLEVMKGIYQMVSNKMVEEDKADEIDPEKRVDLIFSSIDKDASGSLTLDEFLEGAQKDSTILSLLNCN